MENENSVCFIGKITEISAISGADKIVLAKINGWSSVVQKDIHSVGDLVLCITEGAVIPEEFATTHGIINYLKKGNRVRTVKLKGVFSECILIPINKLEIDYNYLQEGDDCMSYFNIFKYEEPIRQLTLSSVPKVYFKIREIHKLKMWKSWFNYQVNKFRKTFNYKDNENFSIYYKFPNSKNAPNLFTEEDTVSITRKMHGSNARYGIVKKKSLTWKERFNYYITKDPWLFYEYVYGSHRVEKGSDSQGYYSSDIWLDIAIRYDIPKKLWWHVKQYYTPEEIGSGFILYGEVYGPGIQKNYHYNLVETELACFDIEINGEYISLNSYMSNMVGLGLPNVPLLYIGKWSKGLQDLYSESTKIDHSDIYHEGVVVKCITGDRKKVYKIISPEYLIQNEKLDGTDFH